MGIFEKLITYMGFGDDKEDDEDEYEQVEYSGQNRGKSKVVKIHTNSHIKMVIAKPTSYNDVQRICDELKARRPVIINLQKVEPEEAQRILDFLGGSVYALGGEMQKISNSVFTVTPDNIDVVGGFEINDDIRNVIIQ